MFYNEDSFVNGYNQDTPVFILAHTHASWRYYYLSDSYSVARPWIHRVIGPEGDIAQGGSGHHQRLVLYRFICTEDTKHF